MKRVEVRSDIFTFQDTNQMQDYGGSISNKRGYHECDGRECSQESSFSVNQRSFFQKSYGNKYTLCSIKLLLVQHTVAIIS